MIDQAKRDEWRRLLATADPAPWRFVLGDAESSDGHILTSAPADKSWTAAPILCSHIFGPRDAANYALMAAAPTAIPALLTEVDILESQTRSDRNLIDAQWAKIHTQRKRIETLESERTVDAVAAHETSVSIAAWQDETFGPATTTWDRLDRSDDAMRGAMWNAKIADLDVPRPNLSRAIRAAEELAELIELLVRRDDDPGAGIEVADVQIVLAGIPAVHGQEQSALVDEKMAINRARSWTLTGDGHGQHVDEVKP